jgi:hypothetical protein
MLAVIGRGRTSCACSAASSKNLVASGLRVLVICRAQTDGLDSVIPTTLNALSVPSLIRRSIVRRLTLRAAASSLTRQGVSRSLDLRSSGGIVCNVPRGSTVDFAEWELSLAARPFSINSASRNSAIASETSQPFHRTQYWGGHGVRDFFNGCAWRLRHASRPFLSLAPG